MNTRRKLDVVLHNEVDGGLDDATHGCDRTHVHRELNASGSLFLSHYVGRVVYHVRFRVAERVREGLSGMWDPGGR